MPNKTFKLHLLEGEPVNFELAGKPVYFSNMSIKIVPVKHPEQQMLVNLWDFQGATYLHYVNLQNAIKHFIAQNRLAPAIEELLLTPIAAGRLGEQPEGLNLGVLTRHFAAQPLFKRLKNGNLDVPPVLNTAQSALAIVQQFIKIIRMAKQHHIGMGFDYFGPDRFYWDGERLAVMGLGILDWIQDVIAIGEKSPILPLEVLACMAPEALKSTATLDTEPTQVYSIGAMIYCILSATVPYQDLIINQSLGQALRVKLELKKTPFTSEDKKRFKKALSKKTVQLLEQCFEYHYHNRPALEAVLNAFG